MGQPHPTSFLFILVHVSGIQTWIIAVEGEHADYLATSTAPLLDF